MSLPDAWLAVANVGFLVGGLLLYARARRRLFLGAPASNRNDELIACGMVALLAFAGFGLAHVGMNASWTGRVVVTDLGWLVFASIVASGVLLAHVVLRLARSRADQLVLPVAAFLALLGLVNLYVWETRDANSYVSTVALPAMRELAASTADDRRLPEAERRRIVGALGAVPNELTYEQRDSGRLATVQDSGWLERYNAAARRFDALPSDGAARDRVHEVRLHDDLRRQLIAFWLAVGLVPATIVVLGRVRLGRLAESPKSVATAAVVPVGLVVAALGGPESDDLPPMLGLGGQTVTVFELLKLGLVGGLALVLTRPHAETGAGRLGRRVALAAIGVVLAAMVWRDTGAGIALAAIAAFMLTANGGRRRSACVIAATVALIGLLPVAARLLDDGLPGAAQVRLAMWSDPWGSFDRAQVHNIVALSIEQVAGVVERDRVEFGRPGRRTTARAGFSALEPLSTGAAVRRVKQELDWRLDALDRGAGDRDPLVPRSESEERLLLVAEELWGALGGSDVVGRGARSTSAFEARLAQARRQLDAWGGRLIELRWAGLEAARRRVEDLEASAGRTAGPADGMRAKLRAAAGEVSRREQDLAIALADVRSPDARLLLPKAPSVAAARVIDYTLGRLGVAYRWGGNHGVPFEDMAAGEPDPDGGFDCSSLLAWAFAKGAGVFVGDWTAAQWSRAATVPGALRGAGPAQGGRAPPGGYLPGDILFFNATWHVALSVGDGLFVHAPYTGEVVKVSRLSGYKPVWGWIRYDLGPRGGTAILAPRSAGGAAAVAASHPGHGSASAAGRDATTPQPDNFQLQRSLYALRAGGPIGVGLGQGKPEAVPAVTEDVALASLGEALGLAGVLLVVLFVLLVAGRGIQVGQRQPHPTVALLSIGLASLVGLQALLNLGGISGALPFTGLTFPLISRSGTGLVGNFFALALLAGLAARTSTSSLAAPRLLSRRNLLGAAGFPAAFLLVLASVALLQLTGRTLTPGPVLAPLPDRGAPFLHAADQWRAAAYRVSRGAILDRYGNVLTQTTALGRPRTYPDREITISLGRALERLDLEFADELTAARRRDRPAGPNLVTTIDAGVQKALARAFTDGAREGGLADLRSVRGAAVLLDATDGAILGIESRPTLSLAELQAPQRWARAEAAERRSGFAFRHLDRAVQGLYPPGSVFKAVTAAAVLDLGLHRVDSEDFDYRRDHEERDKYGLPIGWHQLRLQDGPPIYDGNHPHGADWRFNLEEAFAYSDNVAFAQMGLQLGPVDLVDYARRFGFERPLRVEGLGSATSTLDGAPAERPDLRFLAWSDSNLARTAFGQAQVTATPLQMALVPAAIANGGVIMRPRLVAGFRSAGGAWIHRYEPQVLRGTRLAATTLAGMRQIMHASVTYGLARTARLNPRNAAPGVAGKTGSAEWSDDPDSTHSWFIGYFPAEAPRLALAVVVERGGPGPRVAARIAKHVFGSPPVTAYLRRVGVR